MDLANYESGMEMTGGSEETPVETPAEEVPVEETPEEATPSPAADPKEGETPVEEETPAEETPIEGETPGEPMLYETPDGRKITAEQLQTEWKDNFLPEFTRKSQRLSELERNDNINSTPQDEPAWKKEGYEPKNYAEVIQIAKEEALEEIKKDAQAKIDSETAIKDAVETELSQLKLSDPKLDENALFLHANKYGFSSLKHAHANMSDMQKTVENTEQKTIKNLKDREVDPISTNPGGEVSEVTGYDPSEMGQFDGANEYLSHLKKGK